MKRELPVVELAAPSRVPDRVAISRTVDRRVTIAGVAVAAAFLILAFAAALLPPSARVGAWLPLHLVLAGAAGTAVAATMPFFAATLTAGPPAPAAARLAAVLLIAAGALGVTSGFAGQDLPRAAAGGVSYLVGLIATLGVSLYPLRAGPRREGRVTVAAYVVAVLEVVAGVAIATLFVGGDAAVAGDWSRLKPAHAWLNLLGFLALVITATMIHLVPTVLGTRIRPRPSRTVAVVATAVGAPLVAAGFALGELVLADLGSLVALCGAFALGVYVAGCYRDRGRWTTDLGWHRVMAWHLILAAGWYGAGVALAAGRVLAFGPTPSGWLLAPLVAPLAIGWVGQAVVGAWGHLIPAIGPGDPARHARQRGLLGRGVLPRLVVLNTGVLVMTAGLAADVPTLTLTGFALVAVATALELVLVLGALAGPDLEPAAALARRHLGGMR